MNSMGTETSANQKHLTSSGNYAGAVRRVQYLKANVIHRINRLTKKNLYGINGLREKHLKRIQHPLTLKTQQTRNRGDLFQFHKHNLQKDLLISCFVAMSTFTTLVNIVLEVLTTAIKQEK